MTDYECSECGPLEGELIAMKHQTENPSHHIRQKPEPSPPSVEMYDDDDEGNRFEGPQEQDEYFDESYVNDNDD
jgi:hypothetical protein